MRDIEKVLSKMRPEIEKILKLAKNNYPDDDIIKHGSLDEWTWRVIQLMNEGGMLEWGCLGGIDLIRLKQFLTINAAVVILGYDELWTDSL